jgi:hypothetical protein
LPSVPDSARIRLDLDGIELHLGGLASKRGASGCDVVPLPQCDGFWMVLW